MNPSLVGFWILAALSVATALGLILSRNPTRGALLLVLNFICLAVLYLLLNAQVLAVLQILVYAGAIMVLFLFVIMLLNLGGETTADDPLGGSRILGLTFGQPFWAAVFGLALLGGLGYGIVYVARTPPAPAAAQPQGIPQIQLVGWELFTRYVYPFELTSILLLVGVIGVVLLTRGRRLTRPEASDGGS